MTTHQYLIQLAASFTSRHPEYGEDVARWLSWCLPRGIDPLRPAALAIDCYQRETSCGTEPLRSWLHWSRPRRDRHEGPRPVAALAMRRAGRATPGARRRPAAMLSADQTRRLLRAADRHRGEPAAVALFLLATTDRIRLQQICRIDLADIDVRLGGPGRLVLHVPAGPVLALPKVVADHVADHLAAYPKAREVAVEGDRSRVPLLRNRAGGRTTPTGLGQGIRRIAATADHDIGVLAYRITPGWLTEVDLRTW
ncbi:hypothetical protein [Phytohabitans kaempferiae]|uniref:Tyr recombinase domain-containing protein n=1 Tax=Phytohabitans kaempferiae TaxID=1620943 RepID=A0ABV6M233_9ACTN